MERVRMSLHPFTNRYVRRNGPIGKLKDGEDGCGEFFGSRMDKRALGCVKKMGFVCAKFAGLKEAKSRCGRGCEGVTQTEDGEFEVRNGEEERSGVGERSWRKIADPCLKRDEVAKTSTALGVWNALHDAVDAALEDDSLNLMTPLGPPREDGSIFVSIASYRDVTCGATLKKAYERAKFPEKISVGIVQQNCDSPDKCYTGTGWAETRRWVPRIGPDPDCARDFCESALGKKHCDAGRVRILRLDEIDALGPFFTRFVNSKLWRGENFYMQIDAHTDFRSGWDVSLDAQMKATKSYPMSIISNYPIGGSPTDTQAWKELKNPTMPDDGFPPSCLCGCSFETVGARMDRYTVRLGQTGRHYKKELGRPRRSLFVAAGFFIAHGSIVDNVGFDPFLPYLFMGEELALSVRFYTNGYDIYGPSVEVLRHEYIRKESPKFWESVGHVYSNGGMHNDLTDIIVQRVQFLVKFPEAASDDKIVPQNLLTRIDRFGVGTVRTVDQFVKLSEMDLKEKTQNTPRWCQEGLEPGDELAPLPEGLMAQRKTQTGGMNVDLSH